MSFIGLGNEEHAMQIERTSSIWLLGQLQVVNPDMLRLSWIRDSPSPKALALALIVKLTCRILRTTQNVKKDELRSCDDGGVREGLVN